VLDALMAGGLQLEVGEVGALGLGLLQAQQCRAVLIQKLQPARHARLQRVHVPGGGLHAQHDDSGGEAQLFLQQCVLHHRVKVPNSCGRAMGIGGPE